MEDTKTTQQPRQEASPSYVSAPGAAAYGEAQAPYPERRPAPRKKKKSKRGYYALAFIATVMSLIVLVAFDGIQQRLRTRHRPEMEIQLECETMGDVMVELNRQADHLFIARR